MPGAPRRETTGSEYRRTDSLRPALGDGKAVEGGDKLCMS